MTYPAPTRLLHSFISKSLVVTTAIFFCGTAAIAAVQWPPQPSIPDGLGVQLKADTDSAETLGQVRDLGLKWVRRGFIWEAVEKEKGVYDFSKYDRIMADCKARGLTVVGCIAFSNKLYGTHAKDEPGLGAYAKFAAALVARYKDYDIVWEIWNEPNTMTFWGKHGKKGNSKEYAGEYLGLVKAAVPAMKKANPKCIILGGSVSNMWTESYAWMDFMFEGGVLKTGIDGWSVHPYGLKSPEDYIEAYDIMRKSMAKHGGPANIPVLNTERGFPLGKVEGNAGGEASMAKEYQAWHVVRQFLVDMLCDVNVTIWYEWIGSKKEGFSLYSSTEQLPGYTACDVLIKQLRDYRLDKRINIGDPRDFALRFTTKSGAEKIVVWTSPPPHQPADKVQPHAVKVPVTANGPVEVVDIYGKSSQLKATGGFVELTATGAPQYLIIKK